MRRKTRGSASPHFVYRSNYLYEADLVANELERAGIAHYRAEESPAGVRWAMPLSPVADPGTCFVVIVPGPHAKRAKRLVKSLPVSKHANPGVWRRGTTDAEKSFWRTLAWCSLISAAVGLLAAIISVLRE